jgi:hypothetical protein
VQPIEEIAAVMDQTPSGSVGKDISRLEYDVAELNKTMQAMLLAQRRLDARLELLAADKEQSIRLAAASAQSTT